MEVPEFLKEIANAFGSIAGVEAVAWCGSAAMGVADAHSDFDFYVYTNAPVPVESRKAVILERSRHSQLNNTFWELEANGSIGRADGSTRCTARATSCLAKLLPGWNTILRT